MTLQPTHRKLMRPILWILMCSALAGCVSTHDMNSGPSLFGGGVMLITQSDGSQVIISRSNYAPLPDIASARATWREKANQLCGKDGYTEHNVDETIENAGMGMLQVTRSAIVKCNHLGQRHRQ